MFGVPLTAKEFKTAPLDDSIGITHMYLEGGFLNHVNIIYDIELMNHANSIFPLSSNSTNSLPTTTGNSDK